jgi:hypothetical protein
MLILPGTNLNLGHAISVEVSVAPAPIKSSALIVESVRRRSEDHAEDRLLVGCDRHDA